MAREAPDPSQRRQAAWWALAALLLVVLPAAALSVVPDRGLDQEDPATLLVAGDLKLADDDQGPSNGVQATFVADNLAPGDRATGRLQLLEEHPLRLEAASEDRWVRLSFHEEASPNGTPPLAAWLLVDELTYQDQDLRARVAEACGAPVTLATLVGCAREAGAPMDRLAPPGRGAELVLTVRMDPAAGNQAQGGAAGFTVRAELIRSVGALERAPAPSWGGGQSSGSGAGAAPSGQAPGDRPAGPPDPGSGSSPPGPGSLPVAGPASSSWLEAWQDEAGGTQLPLAVRQAGLLVVEVEPFLAPGDVPRLFLGLPGTAG